MKSPVRFSVLIALFAVTLGVTTVLWGDIATPAKLGLIGLGMISGVLLREVIGSLRSQSAA